MCFIAAALTCATWQCVETAMRCSAKAAVEEVHAVFNQATHMVMYPVAPLYDEHTDVRVGGCAQSRNAALYLNNTA